MAYILLFQFSAGAFIPNCDFNQFAKIPFLIEHYQLHKEEANLLDAQYDVLDFVYTHFILCEEHEHPENEDHDRLPMQSFSSSIQFSNDQSNLQLAEKITVVSEQVFHLIEIEGISFIDPIFHPPTS